MSGSTRKNETSWFNLYSWYFCSMYGDKIKLVRESLKYLVNLMNEEDNFALVKFDSYAVVVNNCTKMSEENKTLLIENID